MEEFQIHISDVSHWQKHSMSMIIHAIHYCSNMTFCRWPSWHSIPSCHHNGKDIISTISSAIPWRHSEIHYTKSWTWQDVFHIPWFWCSPQRCGLVVQDKASTRPGDVCKMIHWSALKHCPEKLHGNLSCLSSCSKYHCAWRWSVLKHCLVGKLLPNFKYHQVFPMYLTCPLASLLLPLGAIWKARYMGHVLPVLMTYKSEFRTIFKRSLKKGLQCFRRKVNGSQKKRYDMLTSFPSWVQFNDMVVTYSVPY